MPRKYVMSTPVRTKPFAAGHRRLNQISKYYGYCGQFAFACLASKILTLNRSGFQYISCDK
jgi:hypothetical protein